MWAVYKALTNPTVWSLIVSGVIPMGILALGLPLLWGYRRGDSRNKTVWDWLTLGIVPVLLAVGGLVPTS